jgi:serine protease AprX
LGIGPPADSPYAISVGALEEDGTVSSYSSIGPTYDGRLKPEVVALGHVFTAYPKTPNSFALVDGTSMSAPIVAGLAALLLEANPDWTNYQMREALIKTASNTQEPNNHFGWGLINPVKGKISIVGE